VRRGLRLLPEGRGIFPHLTVAENVDAVAAQNCGHEPMFDPGAIYRLFPVMDERRSSIAGKLSGGQQQMLALSLALLGAPRCLMLDEPPNLVERMFDQLRALSREHGLPTLLVEQNVAAAMRSGPRHDPEQRSGRFRREAGGSAQDQRLALFSERMWNLNRVSLKSGMRKEP